MNVIHESKDDLAALVNAYEDGYSLEQPFYLDQGIFDTDFERVIEPMWLFVDHVSRIPNSGDYFLYEIGGESIIIVRGRDKKIRAFY
ncbi:MAG: hypothetical protein H8E30_17225, partial [Alphaproteobacteria bacterium]|nr:hypothetical protein [Alphaproteobacteria bacterium]